MSSHPGWAVLPDPAVTPGARIISDHHRSFLSVTSPFGSLLHSVYGNYRELSRPVLSVPNDWFGDIASSLALTPHQRSAPTYLPHEHQDSRS